MKVLVTGGAGFIGSHIVDLLIANGHQVTIVDNLSAGRKENVNPKAEFYNLDITSTELEKAFKQSPEAVIHCAAQIDVNLSISNPKQDADINIGGTLAILKLCRKYRIKRFIYLNSAAEAGDPIEFPITENTPISPISPYGISKAAAHQYIRILSRQYGISAISLRLSNVYGPRQGTTGEGGVVSIFGKGLHNQKNATIFGDGEQTRDFIYVEDAAEAILKALTSIQEGQYNVGTGIETSINKLFKVMSELTESEKVPAYAPARPGDIRRSVFSIGKIKKELNWEPKTTLKEGLKKTLESLK